MILSGCRPRDLEDRNNSSWESDREVLFEAEGRSHLIANPRFDIRKGVFEPDTTLSETASFSAPASNEHHDNEAELK